MVAPPQLGVAAGNGGQHSPEGGAPVAEHRTHLLLRYLDVVLVVLVAAPALALGAPVLGYLVGAAGWIGQRLLALVDRGWIESFSRFGLSLFEAFGRIWLMAGAIVIAAVAGGRRDGLAAALVIFCAYSVAFALRILEGRPEGPGR